MAELRCVGDRVLWRRGLGAAEAKVARVEAVGGGDVHVEATFL